MRKSFGEARALTGVSFDAASGIVGLIGVNGAGKTTLLRILSGGLVPDAGFVALDDSDATSRRGLRELRRRSALMPQTLVPPRGLTVMDFMAYMGWLRAVPRAHARSRAMSILRSLELSSVSDRKLTDLSGGMLRRVTFAQALISDPDLLILDEPTTGVDPEQRLVMRDLVTAHGRDRLTVVSSHVMEDVDTTADRVLMLDEGSVVFDGTIERLREVGRSLVGETGSLNPLEAAFMHLRGTRG